MQAVRRPYTLSEVHTRTDERESRYSPSRTHKHTHNSQHNSQLYRLERERLPTTRVARRPRYPPSAGTYMYTALSHRLPALRVADMRARAQFESDDIIEHMLDRYGPPRDSYDALALWPLRDPFASTTATTTVIAEARHSHGIGHVRSCQATISCTAACTPIISAAATW